MFPFKKISKSSQSEMRDIAARICRDYLHGAWKTIPAEEIQLRRISGGLSNFLYYVSLPDSQLTAAAVAVTGSPILSSKRPRKDSDNNNNVRLQYGEELHHHHDGDKEPKEVLLRIYGQAHGDHALEAMLTESVVFALLSERRLGPRLHGIFPGGRIEQYIPARPLKTGELADRRISMKISEKMAEIHSLDIPVSKEPDWIWKTTHRWLASIDNMFNNNNCAEGGEFIVPVPDSKREIKGRLRKLDFKKEVQWLREQLKDEVDFLVVFSHNDLQEGNILIRDERRGRTKSATFVDTSETTLSDFEESSTRLDAIMIGSQNGGANKGSAAVVAAVTGEKGSRKRNKSNGQDAEEGEVAELIGRREIVEEEEDPTAEDEILGYDDRDGDSDEPELMIIDFEYCSYNYRGFDLANHFLEWTFDYTNKDYPFFFHKKFQYPNHDQMETFLDTYLKKSRRLKGFDDVDEEDEGQVKQLDGGQGYAADKALLKREIHFFTMASHLFWSLWAIVYCDQEIEFGYWEYADCRLKEYFMAKEKYLTKYRNGQSARVAVKSA